MFQILYVKSPARNYTSPYNQPTYNIENNKEHIAVLVESLFFFRTIEYIGMGLYLVLWDVVFHIEDK